MTQYIAITQSSYTVPGDERDERSRTHPGHGYPEYTETVDVVHKFTSDEDLKTWILKQDKYYGKYELYKVTPVTVSKQVLLDIQ